LSPAYALGGEIVDLTYPFSKDTVYWPTGDGFSLSVDSKGVTDKGYYYSANSFCGAEHGGTHIDTPIHFAEGMPSVDEIDLKRLVAPAVLIDLTQSVGDKADYLVTIEDMVGWEKRNGRIPDNAILLLRTGWGRFYPNRKQYLGTEERGVEAVADLHFPGLDPSAARWLTENRAVAAVGLDTASIDYGQSQLFESHQILFKAQIPAFENVANLDRLPSKGFTVIALPMKIEGGSGGPLRIIAILD
jgi:kynurenine formamidase